MDINLFSKIVKKLGNSDLDDFEYKHGEKIYGFKNVGDGSWDDQGKYQYKDEKGQLIEMDEKYKEVESFNYGVSRCVQRSGSYFSDYYYDYYSYDMYKIEEVLIPAHTESKWNKINIDLTKIIDEKEEEEKKRIEMEKNKLEKEKAEKERLIKLYPMNKQEIIKMVNKNLKKKGTAITIKNMRKEYFDIVVAKKLENQEWIDYHKNEFENV